MCVCVCVCVCVGVGGEGVRSQALPSFNGSLYGNTKEVGIIHACLILRASPTVLSFIHLEHFSMALIFIHCLLLQRSISLRALSYDT